MILAALEDFGASSPSTAPSVPAPPDGNEVDFATAYSAGWDDAMRQVDEEQSRVADRLAARLDELRLEQSQATAAAVASLEPLLHEVFDKLLPHAVDRTFLAILMEHVQAAITEGADDLILRVAPEEAPAVSRLLERMDPIPLDVKVEPEAALTLSQALVTLSGQERRIDLEAVLQALDDALEAFLNTFKPEMSDD